ncbi:hypothetical protein Trydic_g20647, partial [Trypoxylus dichotomus]
GGKVASAWAYPFMVSIRWYPNHHFCGGTIVNKLWILTSAHCVAEETTATVFAVVGTNTLSFGGRTVTFREIIVHPSFNDTGYLSNDIAMIQLSSALRYLPTIAPVVLDRAGSQSVINVTLIGWGETRNNGSASDFLRDLSTQTITPAACSI